MSVRSLEGSLPGFGLWTTAPHGPALHPSFRDRGLSCRVSAPFLEGVPLRTLSLGALGCTRTLARGFLCSGTEPPVDAGYGVGCLWLDLGCGSGRGPKLWRPRHTSGAPLLRVDSWSPGASWPSGRARLLRCPLPRVKHTAARLPPGLGAAIDQGPRGTDVSGGCREVSEG